MFTEAELGNGITPEVMARDLVLTVQPTHDSLVWQQNRLAAARYKLNPREQKLLLYVISMIEPEAQEFGKCKVSVQGYAEMTGLRHDDLYQELRDTALSIREKTLIVEGILEPGMRRPVKRYGSWFEYVDEATRDGYITIKLSSWLKPFLLEVRREFFKYKLKYVLNLKGEYSIRLYQWLKRWQYAGRKTESVTQLRLQLGATEVDHEGKVLRENLAAYKHFKYKALTPALAEINAKTDLSVTTQEEKIKGSKAVGAVTFIIGNNQANQGNLDKIRLSLQGTGQTELALDKSDDLEKSAALSINEVAGNDRLAVVVQVSSSVSTETENTDQIDAWMTEFGLTLTQRVFIQECVRERGLEYVVEKAEIIRSEPRENAARAFLAALKQDWKAPQRVKVRRPTGQMTPNFRPEPPGWRAFLKERYPDAELPKTYRQLTERYPSLEQEIRARLEPLPEK